MGAISRRGPSGLSRQYRSFIPKPHVLAIELCVRTDIQQRYIMRSNVPNFICIGAQKAGTSTLYSILSQHPDILLSTPKETFYFQDDEKFSDGLAGYLSYFPNYNGQPVTGGIEPSYMPLEKVPERLAELLGKEVRILACLRNPVDRAYSHYWMNRRKGFESLSFEAALVAETERIKSGDSEQLRYGYVRSGLYAKHLRRYFDVFDPSHIKVISFEQDLISATEDTIKLILKFLGVQELALDVEEKANTARMPRAPVVSKLLYKRNGKPSLLRWALPSKRLRSALRSYLEKPFTPPKLDVATRTEIFDRYFSADVRQLEAMLGAKFSSWG